MLIIKDYKCLNDDKCGVIFESLEESNTTTIECIYCGKEAHVLVSCPTIKLDGTDPAFSTAYDQWATLHETQGKRKHKFGGRSSKKRT